MHVVSDILSALSVNQLMIFHEVLNVRLAMAQIEVQIMTFVIMRFFSSSLLHPLTSVKVH
jgi:hypothetical protein